MIEWTRFWKTQGYPMRDLITAAQMRKAEADEMATGRVTGLELMERAGRGVVDALLRVRPDFSHAPQSAAVLCGPGNNGGDGYVIARLLAERGWDVEVFALGDPLRLPEDALKSFERWGGRVSPLGAFAGGQTVGVDALFGTGLSRAIPTECAEALARLTAMYSVAVDCPSGLNVDTGQRLGAVWTPDLCVTFHKAKIGHYLSEVSRSAPQIVDIGLKTGDSCEVALVDADKAWLDQVAYGFEVGAHKYDRGHSLVLGGGLGRGGAGRLAARAALRAGAGLVTLAIPQEAIVENAARLDAVMIREVNAPEDFGALLGDPRFSSICLGPGLGVGARTRDMVRFALSDPKRRVVLDADALTSFADDPASLFALVKGQAVMTPHEGEFARLFPDLGERVRTVSKLDAAREAAMRSGMTVLLKGAATVIASPGGRTSIHAALYEQRVPWLGTAGAGDVLSGMIAGLLAGPSAVDFFHDRIEAATWLHAEAARNFGPALIAEDIADQIPNVLGKLGY